MQEEALTLDDFVRDRWYAAAWSCELASGIILRRKILGKHIVFWRGLGGSISALLDYCPHRAARLSDGKIVGDEIECAYHGLRFNGLGKCARNPHGNRRADNIETPSFHIIEKHGVLWIWNGRVEEADQHLIPDFFYLEQYDDFVHSQRGYLYIKANYLLISDNLLDLSHTQFLHPNLLGSEAIINGDHDVSVHEDKVSVKIWARNAPAPKAFEVFFPLEGKPVDHWLQIDWKAPGYIHLFSGVTSPGETKADGWENISAHLITPADKTTSHYFFHSSRDPRSRRLPFDPKTMEEILTVNVPEWHPFLIEDKPMLEAQQGVIDELNLCERDLITLSSDAGPMRARIVIKRLLHEKSAQ